MVRPREPSSFFRTLSLRFSSPRPQNAAALFFHLQMCTFSAKDGGGGERCHGRCLQRGSRRWIGARRCGKRWALELQPPTGDSTTGDGEGARTTCRWSYIHLRLTTESCNRVHGTAWQGLRPWECHHPPPLHRSCR